MAGLGGVDPGAPMVGELRKQSPHIGVFRRRNVVLNATTISVYNVGDAEKALAIIPITAYTIVSEIKMGTVRGGHGAAHLNQAIFQVICEETKSTRSYIFRNSSDDHCFSAASLEEAQKWKEAIEARAQALANVRDGGLTACDQGLPLENMIGAEIEGVKVLRATESTILTRDEKTRNLRERMKRSASQRMPQVPRHVNATLNLIQQSQWHQVLVTNGIRIMAEVSKENPCLRVSCVLPCSPDRALRLYYDFERRSQWDSLTESVQLLNNDQDDQILRTMHCKLRGTKVGGLSIAPRDYVVDSIWRKDDDGSVVIIETSSKEHVVPLQPGYVRAEIFAMGMTLCPRKQRRSARRSGDLADESLGAILNQKSKNNLGDEEDDIGIAQDCLLQMAVHADVGGWLAKMPIEWGRHWLYSFMLRVIGFKQILEEENYETVDLQKSNFVSAVPHLAKSKTESVREEASQSQTPGEVRPKVEGTLSPDHVYNTEEPFNLRGKSYLTDRKKETSSGAMFELIAMDLWEVDGPIDHVAVNMKGGLAEQYLAAPGPKPFLFIIQFQIPGPPFLSFVGYFAAKPGAIGDVTPFSRLFADFIDGTDQFRDSRFKFIPRVVKGSYVVKSAVGQTPAILGHKLVCSYFRGDNYFEIDVDVGSSSVAGGVLRVVKGYITALVIDLCFLLEGQHEEELPEAVLGSLRFERLSLDMAKKWVPRG